MSKVTNEVGIDFAVEVSPYKAHQLINDRLVKEGIIDPKTSKQKVIPPQMMYNYTMGRIRKNQVPLIPVTSKGRILIVDLNKWMDKYIKNLVVRYADLTIDLAPAPK